MVLARLAKRPHKASTQEMGGFVRNQKSQLWQH